MERKGVIYIATVNQDKSYIGLTVDFPERKKQHLWHSEIGNSDTHFHNAIRKHGAESVEWRILEDDIPESRLPDREELWIGFYDTYYNGYNMTEGGQVSLMQNPEIAAKVSATHKAKSARGEHQSQRPETRAKISATKKAQAARGELPMQNPEIASKVAVKISATMKAKAARGELPSQQPEIAARVSATQKAKAAHGELPSQKPETQLKMRQGKSRSRLRNQRESGQEFFLDMDLDED